MVQKYRSKAEQGNTKKHAFPAGKYIICDTGYIIPDEEWSGILDRTGYLGLFANQEPDGKIPAEFDDGIWDYKGFRCFTGGTAYGDGCYSLEGYSKKFRIGVDAGMIGIHPYEMATADFINSYTQTELAVVEFSEDFLVWMEDFTFHFGDKLTIVTGGGDGDMFDDWSDDDED